MATNRMIGNETMSHVADVMQREVITVSPRSSLRDLARLLSESEISGAPVVDSRGRVLGVVSATDILRAATDEDDERQRVLDQAERRGNAYYRDLGRLLSDVELEFLLGRSDDLDERTVEEIMTSDQYTVEPQMSLSDAARIMADHHAHRALVLDGEELIGIVTAFDIVRAVADGRL
ncbi:MAG: CBS domain-containing protein [Gemmatimonadota bacterium]